MESEENVNITQPSEMEVPRRSELSLLLGGFFSGIYHNAFLRILVKTVVTVVSVIGAIAFVFALYFYIIPEIQELSFFKPRIVSRQDLTAEKQYKTHITALGKEVQKLSRKFAAYTPGQSYLVINTTDNRFYLYRNRTLLREGFCSSGSYIHLTSAEGTRHWIFKTPKGKFKIQQKITKPLWKRPDWSFIEEGLPVPSADDPSRYEFGVLGDYAMSLGDGYLIHGTIYPRFIGMPVTHGCVRLGDDDLKVIFNTLSVGSKIYIF